MDKKYELIDEISNALIDNYWEVNWDNGVQEEREMVYELIGDMLDKYDPNPSDEAVDKFELAWEDKSALKDVLGQLELSDLEKILSEIDSYFGTPEEDEYPYWDE